MNLQSMVERLTSILLDMQVEQVTGLDRPCSELTAIIRELCKEQDALPFTEMAKSDKWWDGLKGEPEIKTTDRRSSRK